MQQDVLLSIGDFASPLPPGEVCVSEALADKRAALEELRGHIDDVRHDVLAEGDLVSISGTTGAAHLNACFGQVVRGVGSGTPSRVGVLLDGEATPKAFRARSPRTARSATDRSCDLEGRFADMES